MRSIFGLVFKQQTDWYLDKNFRRKKDHSGKKNHKFFKNKNIRFFWTLHCNSPTISRVWKMIKRWMTTRWIPNLKGDSMPWIIHFLKGKNYFFVFSIGRQLDKTMFFLRFFLTFACKHTLVQTVRNPFYIHQIIHMIKY